MRRDGSTYDDYTLVERIGEGPISEVFRAVQGNGTNGEQVLALKRIPRIVARDRAFAGAFLDGAARATGIHHPYLARLLDYGEQDGTLYTVSEFRPGYTLRDVLQYRRYLRQPLSSPMVVFLVLRLAEGLKVAHAAVGDDGAARPFVHGDIKPSNITVGFDGTPVLHDLGTGIACRLDPDSPLFWVAPESFQYLAPEQVHGLPPDPRTDVYALGVIMFECLTLEPFLPSAPLFEMVRQLQELDFHDRLKRLKSSGVEPDVSRVVHGALQRKPSARFPDAAAFSAALRELQLPGYESTPARWVALLRALRDDAEQVLDEDRRHTDLFVHDAGPIEPWDLCWASTALCTTDAWMETSRDEPEAPARHVKPDAGEGQAATGIILIDDSELEEWDGSSLSFTDTITLTVGDAEELPEDFEEEVAAQDTDAPDDAFEPTGPIELRVEDLEDSGDADDYLDEEAPQPPEEIVLEAPDESDGGEEGDLEEVDSELELPGAGDEDDGQGVEPVAEEPAVGDPLAGETESDGGLPLADIVSQDTVFDLENALARLEQLDAEDGEAGEGADLSGEVVAALEPDAADEEAFEVGEEEEPAGLSHAEEDEPEAHLGLSQEDFMTTALPDNLPLFAPVAYDTTAVGDGTEVALGGEEDEQEEGEEETSIVVEAASAEDEEAEEVGEAESADDSEPAQVMPDGQTDLEAAALEAPEPEDITVPQADDVSVPTAEAVGSSERSEPPLEPEAVSIAAEMVDGTAAEDTDLSDVTDVPEAATLDELTGEIGVSEEALAAEGVLSEEEPRDIPVSAAEGPMTPVETVSEEGESTLAEEGGRQGDGGVEEPGAEAVSEAVDGPQASAVPVEEAGDDVVAEVVSGPDEPVSAGEASAEVSVVAEGAGSVGGGEEAVPEDTGGDLVRLEERSDLQDDEITGELAVDVLDAGLADESVTEDTLSAELDAIFRETYEGAVPGAAAEASDDVPMEVEALSVSDVPFDELPAPGTVDLTAEQTVRGRIEEIPELLQRGAQNGSLPSLGLEEIEGVGGDDAPAGSSREEGPPSDSEGRSRSGGVVAELFIPAESRDESREDAVDAGGGEGEVDGRVLVRPVLPPGVTVGGRVSVVRLLVELPFKTLYQARTVRNERLAPCPVCGYTNNLEEDARCYRCGTPRPPEAVTLSARRGIRQQRLNLRWAGRRKYHPNLALVYDDIVRGDMHYRVLDPLTAHPSTGVLLTQLEPPVSTPLLARMAVQCGRGLQFLHENGVACRPLDDTNIYLLVDSAQLYDLDVAEIAQALTVQARVANVGSLAEVLLRFAPGEGSGVEQVLEQAVQGVFESAEAFVAAMSETVEEHVS